MHMKPALVVRAADAIIAAPQKQAFRKMPFNQAFSGCDVICYLAAVATITDEDPQETLNSGNLIPITKGTLYSDIAKEVLGMKALGYLACRLWPNSVFQTPKKHNLYMAHQPTATEAAEHLRQKARSHVAFCEECQQAHPELVPSYLK